MDLLQMSLTGGALILCIAVIRALTIYRLPNTIFSVLWGIAALRLLLPLSIPLPSPAPAGAGLLPDATQPPAFESSDIPLPGQTAPSYAAGIAAASQPADHGSIAAVLWLSGTILAAAYFGISYLRYMRKFEMSIPDTTPYDQEWLTAHRIFRSIKVQSSDLISSPLTYGILHPVILLPKNLNLRDETTLIPLFTRLMRSSSIMVMFR